MTWAGSTRRDRLPADWPKTTARILKRDPTCTCQGCPRCTPRGCTRQSTDCDHVIPNDDHRDTNLAGKCAPCHAHKSAREGVAARRAQLAKRYRPQPQHPGVKR